MKIIISGKNLQVGADLKEMVNDKLAKLDKFFHSEVEAIVTLSHIKAKNVVEVTIPLKNGVVLRAEEIDTTMENAIDVVVDRITRQLRKHKTNIEKKFRKSDSIRFDMIPEYVYDEHDEEDTSEIKIVKSKRFSVKPMNAEEAVLKMNMLNHDFYVFLNAETDDLNVVYRRKSGQYGLIEPYLDWFYKDLGVNNGKI